MARIVKDECMALENVELSQHLQERYKRLFTQVVVPVMIATSVFLVVSHWEASNQRVFAGIVLMILLVTVNVILSLLKRIPTPWGDILPRSDAFDTLRWCVNFPLNVFIVWSLDAHEAAAMIAWLLLTFGAMVDVQRPPYKLITVSVAFISFCFLVLWFYPTDLRTQIYLVACYLGLIFILWKLERYVVQEMLAVFAERWQRERVEQEAASLQRQAAIGYSTRAVNHELNTLIGVAALSTERIRERQLAGLDTVKDMERLERSLSYMRKVSTLILDGLGTENATKRQVSLAELQNDLRLLLCKGGVQCQARLVFDFPTNAADYCFEERTGSTYLILHNLAKNAHEAVKAKFGESVGGVIRISAVVDKNKLTLSVYDNGIGMTQQQVSDIRKQLITSTKLDGHGLGLQFVWRECQQNHFELAIESECNHFSLFYITFFVIV